MNELICELNSMKTIDFWHQFIENTKTTTIETTTTTETTKDNKMSTELSIKPSFSSSSFFDLQKHPTIQDQVVLCRQIARQLVCDESNAKSKGREMFERRVQKSSKWVTTKDDNEDDNNDDNDSQESFHTTTISDGPPNLKLLLDPRHVKDLSSLDFEANETELIRNQERGQSLSREIIEDLQSPVKNKGNVLFHSRQEKSCEWIVNDVTTTTTTTQLNTNSIKHKYRDFNARAKPFYRQ